MTTTGPFFFLLLPPPPPRPNAFALVDVDGADRCGRRRSAARSADRAATSVSRSDIVADALVEIERQLEEERGQEPRPDDRGRNDEGEAVIGVVVLDPLVGAEVEAQRPPARLEAIADTDMKDKVVAIEREREEDRTESPSFEREREDKDLMEKKATKKEKKIDPTQK